MHLLTTLTLATLLAVCSPEAQAGVTVGAGAGIVPEYAGASSLRAIPILTADYDHASGFFASTTRGVGFQTKSGAFGFSTALGYDSGRSDRQRTLRSGSDALRGMGEIKGSVMGTLGGSVEVGGGVALSLRANLALTNREHGNTYELGVAAPLMTTARSQVVAFGAATWSDQKHAQTFHGVTTAQSRNSIYRVYTPGAGLSKVGLGVNWRRNFSKGWSLSTTFAAFHLTGDAADSPITWHKNAPVVLSTMNYSF